jgi:hypothetical protein
MYSTIGFSSGLLFAAIDFCIDICVTSDVFLVPIACDTRSICYVDKVRSAAEPCRQCTESKLDVSVTATGAVAMMLRPSVP